MLAIIVGTQDSTLDFTSQYDDVVKFAVGLMERRVMVKRAIVVVYELAIKNSENVKEMVSQVVNDLIQEESGSSNYFDELLILITKLTPGNFNYDTLFKVVLVGDY